MNIYNEISSIKGVGPKLQEKLNRCGIFTVLDLLLYFPRDYDFVNSELDLNTDFEKEKAVLLCKMIACEGTIRTRTGKRLTSIQFMHGGIKVAAKWFNQPYVIKNFAVGEEYNLMGTFKKKGNRMEIMNPIVACVEAKKSEIMPIYPLKGDLNSKVLVKLINNILSEIYINDNLPKYMIEKYKLCSLDKAIRNIHFPQDRQSLREAITRLKYQELFTYSMKVVMMRKHIKEKSNGIVFKMSEDLAKLKESLPFPLTGAQSRSVREILLDQKSSVPMNRLVQGDVGSGKTLVALIALFNVYKNGYQTALMAPTEILAIQHKKEAEKFLAPFGVEIELLTGSTTAKEKKRIKERIKSGEPLLVVGTHALIQEDVEFTNMGFVVTDEQHRFGVEQRSKLVNKNKMADTLVMTATPIPRTLSLYLYTDLDISIIDEMPPGRKPIDTMLIDSKQRNKAYSFAYEEVVKGRQVYIVSPLIEENEKLELNSVEQLYDELKGGVFANIEVEILHGKMKPKEKEEVINRFKENKTKVIISTTVIEVGVNVPNATVMIIENAERFGLAQLHQLRGRVGRGEHKSYCVLVANTKNEVTKRRMEIMTESNDGFYISEEDLKLRGAGEMFGMRQHGDEEFILADMALDIKMLKCANAEARVIVSEDTSMNRKICEEVSKNLERSRTYICFN
ncbi:MAG: ATP-dependent DNA helicase RecG [Sarcina sp.]